MLPLIRLALALLLGGWLALGGGPRLQAAAPRTVRVALFPHAPGCFLNEGGKPAGLMVDILEDVARQEGWRLEYRMVPWAESLELARRGEVDLVTTVARLPEREAYLRFGQEPAFRIWTLLYTAKDRHLADVRELEGQVVAIMRNDMNARNFQAFTQQVGVRCVFQEHGTFGEVLQAVEAGRAQAGVTSNLYGYGVEHTFRVQRMPQVFSPFPVYFASGLEAPGDVLEALDRYIREGHLTADSGYHRAIERWLNPQDLHTLPAWARWGGGALLTLLGATGLTILIVRRQVRRATATIRALQGELEQELEVRRRSEGRMAALAQLNADFLFACHHAEAAFLDREWITESFFTLTGYTPEALEAHGCWLFAVHPEDRPAVEAAYASLAEGQRDARTFRLLGADGQVHWVETRVEVTPSDLAPGTLRRLGSVRDITSQVLAEQRLAESLQELRAVYDQSPVMLCVVNEDRRVVFANQAVLAFAGRPEEAVLARRLGSLLGCPHATEGSEGCGSSADCPRCPLLQAVEATLRSGTPFQAVEQHLAAADPAQPTRVLLGSGSQIQGCAGPQVLISLQDITALHHAQVSVTRAEARSRALLVANPDLMFLFSRDGVVLDHKADASDRLLVPPEAFLGRPVRETLPPALATLTEERIGACLATGTPQVYEYDLQQGGPAWYEARMVPCGPEAVLAIVRDVTARHEAQALLARTEERLRLALEATSDGLWDWDLVSGALYWSPRCFTMLGYPEDHRMADVRQWESMVHPEDRPWVMAEVQRQIAERGGFQVEFRYLQADGSPLWVLGRGAAVARDAEGRTTRMVGTHQDLSERRAAEAALREREERLRLLAAVTEEGLVVHERGRILDANDSALQLYRADSLEDLLRHPLEDLVSPGAREMARRYHQDEQDRIYEIQARRLDGSEFPSRIHVRPMRWQGRLVRVTSVQDLTQVQNLEAEVLRREQRLEALLHNLPGVVYLMRVRPDGSSRFDYISPRVTEVFGLSSDPDHPDWDLGAHVHPEDRDRFLASIQQAIQHRDPWTFDGRLRLPGERVRWFHAQSFPVTDGEDLLFHGLLLDTTDRMTALEALVDSEARLQATFEQAAVGMILADLTGRTLQSNRSAQAILGRSAAALSVCTVADLTHPEDFPQELPLIEAVRSGAREEYLLEKRVLRPDGTSLWVEVHVSRIFEPNRQRTRFLAVINDIDARKRAELALAESEARFRSLFHTHSAPFLLIDPSSGAIVDANPSALAYYGYTAEEMRALHISDINVLPPEEAAQERERAFRNEQNYFIFPHRLKSGEVRTVEVHSAPVRFGERSLLFSIIHDITDRMEVEDALRSSERRFRILMNASNDAIFLHGITPTGPTAMAEVSQATCELLGYRREELIHLSPRQIIASEDQPREAETFAQLSARGRLTFDRTLIRKDGSRVPVEISSQLVEVDHQPMVLSIARDVSERKRAQALDTVTEGILAKGRMAAYIAHEINSPLAGIKNAFLLLGDAIPKDHPHHRYVALIHQEISRISNIVKMMYELYRPTSAAPTDILLESLLQDVATLLAPKMRTHQVTLKVELPDPGLRATVASDLLRQILFNLLQNAAEATPPKGSLTCRALQRGDRLQVEVSDEGPGIAEDLSERVFEAGFSTKHAVGTQMGLGLGLGSARKLAQGLGGALTFANHPGEPGCTFTLDLPLVQQEPH